MRLAPLYLQIVAGVEQQEQAAKDAQASLSSVSPNQNCAEAMMSDSNSNSGGRDDATVVTGMTGNVSVQFGKRHILDSRRRRLAKV